MIALLIGPGLLGLAAVAGGGRGGCASDPTRGYAFAESYDESIRTVAVPNWGNDTFARGLELTLTDAIIKRLQRHTPYRVVSTDRADTTLSGTITEARLARLSDDPQTGLAQEQVYELTVRFSWVDNRTGETRVLREQFSAAGVFAPARGAGERIEVGQRDAIDELARDIVESLRAAW